MMVGWMVGDLMVMVEQMVGDLMVMVEQMVLLLRLKGGGAKRSPPR
ncbi:hypothetical protein [Methanocella conradii]|nr:hypothetical protein [Methanocella conradii]MDI6897365.1 hypothetical protein [Methanocella conradii]